MRAGEGRGIESVIMSARQRAAALLESVASGRLSPDQALSLWPDGRGDDPDVETARGTLRRRPEAPVLVAAARALRAERPRLTPRHRAAPGPLGDRSPFPPRARLALVVTGIALLVASAYWLAGAR
ncbi:MAG TPA: hypothetical protein VF406_17050 [Thermodesulfobacteriota bacterium]